MNNKKLVMFLFIGGIVLTILGGTFAYWTWQSTDAQKTLINFTIADNFSCSADGGGDITNSNIQLIPASCTNANYAIKRTVKVNHVSGGGMSLDMWLNVINIDAGLRNSDNFNYALTTNASSCSRDVVATGNFKNVANNTQVPLLESEVYTNSNPSTYYLYIWLDKAETDSATMDQNFHFTLGGSCTDEITNSADSCTEPPTKPVLDDGLIPVTIADNGAVTAVSKNSDDWYSYCDKKWANAVLVSNTNRSTYQAIANGTSASTTIPDADILAYYVWIPRYEYKLLTLGESANGQQKEIKINFVNKTDTKKTSPWFTHPAFTFGTQELDGIWVGKFEMSHNTLSSSTSGSNLGCTNTTCTNASGLRILPNVVSLRYNNISNMWYSLRSMEQSNNVFGISNSDSHMMKNSEWGAVAYLSHSKYGINAEIRINNNKAYTTGCGAATANASGSANCDNAYGTVTSYPQSTTGNISGIFDMSGGAWEYVMGNYGNQTSSSGFTADWFTNNSKYYDLYDSSIFTGNNSTNMAFCSLTTCGGHALNETKNWYSDTANFVNSSGPWFSRGGSYYSTSNAGAFNAYNNNGGSYNGSSFRGVLAASGA